MDSTDFETENFSVSSLIERFLLIPAVSISVRFLLPSLIGTSMESRVVPESEETTNRSFLIRAFTRVDLPALGLPMIEIFNEVSFAKSASIISSSSSYSVR